MSSPFQRLITRAITPALGNLKGTGPGGFSTGGGRKKGPVAGTKSITFTSPNMPQRVDQDAEAFGEAAYLGQVYVMRCIQTIANTIAGLEFRAGIDPMDPANHDPSAPLGQLLGPSTPTAPGGPNPTTSSRAFWAWTICQYIVYGKFGWECQLDQKQIVALWPLVAACLYPWPTDGGTQMFNGFTYQIPRGEIRMKPEQLVYAWRPSLKDWRIPETVLSSATLPIAIARGLDKYMERLLANNMVATTMIVAPPFDEPEGQRAWEDQFLTTFTGVDAAGSTVFGYAERDEEDTSGNPLIQVERIATSPVDAQMLAVSKEAKIDITIALGVPLSLIGNASQRTYANASSEYKNYWTITILPLISELQDHINTFLAPRVGQEVGWFDLSKVAALKPPALFQPPMIGDAINFQVATPAQVANVLGIPAENATGDADTETIDVGEESSQTGAGGTRQVRFNTGRGEVTGQQLMSAYFRWQNAPRNSYTHDKPFHEEMHRYLQREHIDVRTPTTQRTIVRNTEAIRILSDVNRIRQRREQASLQRAADARLAHSVGLVERLNRAAADQLILIEKRRQLEKLNREAAVLDAPEDIVDAEVVDEPSAFDALDSLPELTEYTGDDFDGWVNANMDTLEALVNAGD